jgi:hypothetical protein
VWQPLSVFSDKNQDTGYTIRFMRFQRSIKLIPGVRLNLSKSGVGISAGVRGLRAGIDAKGRAYTNVGLPGTGISSRHYLRPGHTAAPPQLPSANASPSPRVSPIGSLGIVALTAAGLITLGAVLIYLFV